MPKVAQYGNQRVQTQVTSQPRASASAGNAQFDANRQVIAGAASIGQAGAEMVQRFDTTSAEEALVQFERSKNDLFFNPEKGYFNTQGKNAFDASKSTSASLVDLKKKYGENLNPNARTMFEKSADVHILRGEQDIMRHSAAGMKAWEVATINAQVENTVENAALYWNQPEQLAVQNALGRQAVIDASNTEGVGAEATNERLQTYDSTFAKNVITTATAKNSSSGKEMFEKYGDKIEGAERFKIEAAITAKAKAEKVQHDSQRAVLQGASIADQYDSLEDIRNHVNSIKDPELRSKTLSEAVRQYKIKKSAESESRKESFERAEEVIYNGGSAETFKAEDPEAWERLTVKQKRTIEEGKPVNTDWVLYSDLATLPKAELAKVDPTDYLDRLAKAERLKLISAVKTAKGTGSSKDKIDHQMGRTRAAQTTAAIEQVLGKKTKWNDDKRAQADSFYDLLDSEVQYREQQKGSGLSSQEYTDTLSDLTRKVTIEKSAFGVGFLYPDEEQSITDVKPEYVRDLSQYLRDKGIPVTSENLLKAQRQATK